MIKRLHFINSEKHCSISSFLHDSFKSFAAKFEIFKVSKLAILITNLGNTLLNSRNDGNFSVLTFSYINTVFSQSAFRIDKCYIITAFLNKNVFSN